MPQNLVLLEREKSAARLVINRPEKRNPLSLEVCRILTTYLDKLATDDEVKVVGVTSAGDIAFCSGSDLNDVEHMFNDPAFKTEIRADTMRFHETLRNFPKPTISFVNGICFGGGVTLCLDTDLAIASEKAIFGLPEIRYGIVPAYTGPAVLNSMQRRQALWMILTGQNITSEEAYRYGLVNKIVPHEKLREEEHRFYDFMSEYDLAALMACKLHADDTLAFGYSGYAKSQLASYKWDVETERIKKRLGTFLKHE